MNVGRIGTFEKHENGMREREKNMRSDFDMTILTESCSKTLAIDPVKRFGRLSSESLVQPSHTTKCLQMHG